ncbi:MAG TPA: hemerythrin domain-containing protein [Microbacteriaceae bacterium]
MSLNSLTPAPSWGPDCLCGCRLARSCHGFCAALDRHHRGEDRALFPAIEAAYPHLAPVLRALEQDHSELAQPSAMTINSRVITPTVG